MLEQRGDDLAEAVVPLVREVLGEHDLGLHVGAALVPEDRLGLLEVGQLEHEQAVGAHVGERPENGVPLADVEPAAGSQQRGDDPGPAPHVGQPAEGADARVDEIERPLVENVERVVRLGLDERRVDVRGDRELPGLLERGPGEIESGDPGAESRERDGVGPDVALEMNGVLPRDVSEAREVEADDVAEERRILGEAGDAVVGRGDVRGDALVPVRAVDLSIVGHGRKICPGSA